MIAIILVAVLAALGMLGAIAYQHKENATLKKDLVAERIQTQLARDANESLAGSIKGVQDKCEASSRVLTEQHARDLKKRDATKAALARIQPLDMRTAGELQKSLTAPAGKNLTEQCNNAEKILTTLSKDAREQHLMILGLKP